MKLPFILFMCVFYSAGLKSQIPETLSDQLWERVAYCYSMFEDMDDDGRVDYDEIIDDSRNGYLMISGSWPTCGCNCTHSVGAFKDSRGEYTFLEEQTWGCSWVHSIASDKDLASVFPEGLETIFIPEAGDFDGENACFHLDIEIPRYGTDTRITLKTIPFGIHQKAHGLISFATGEDNCQDGCKSLFRIWSLASDITDENTLDHLVRDEIESITATDMDLISETIGNDDSRFSSLMELQQYLREINDIYYFYQKIAHEYLVLGWDRNTSRFYVKEKGPAPAAMSFREFLTSMRYWSPSC